jgi:enoyl-CoA hydratase/carnithine racemase
MGLVTASYPADRLDQEVQALARKMSALPANQLMMQVTSEQRVPIF